MSLRHDRLAAQEIEFRVVEDEAALAAAMPALAERLMAASTDNLDQLLRLQLVAGHYSDAEKTLAALLPAAANVRWQIYARAKRLESEGTPFDEAFRQSFRETMRTIDDRTNGGDERSPISDIFIAARGACGQGGGRILACGAGRRDR